MKIQYSESQSFQCMVQMSCFLGFVFCLPNHLSLLHAWLENKTNHSQHPLLPCEILRLRQSGLRQSRLTID